MFLFQLYKKINREKNYTKEWSQCMKNFSWGWYFSQKFDEPHKNSKHFGPSQKFDEQVRTRGNFEAAIFRFTPA